MAPSPDVLCCLADSNGGRIPDAAIYITSNLGSIFRRKPKPVAGHSDCCDNTTYLTHRQQDTTAGEAQTAVNTEHWNIQFPLRSLIHVSLLFPPKPALVPSAFISPISIP